MTLKQRIADLVTNDDDLTVSITFEDKASLEAFAAACASQGTVRVQMGCCEVGEQKRLWVAVK
jgi:hypothetical protein